MNNPAFFFLGLLLGASSLAAVAAPGGSEAKYCVQVSHVSVSHEAPKLEDFWRANDEIATLLSREAGLNTACYVAPRVDGYTMIWIGCDNPRLTASVREDVAKIVERRLQKMRRIESGKSSEPHEKKS